MRKYNTTSDNYRLYIMVYGIISVIMFLERLEKQENYEECQKIIDAIRDLEEKIESNIPTSINEKSIQETIIEIKNIYGKEMSKEFLLESSQYYSTVIESEVSQIKNLR